jgi:uncharacterized protein
MNRESVLSESEKFVKEYFQGMEGGHNWSHIERVVRNARLINKMEGVGDPFIVELGALFHDIGDRKIDSMTDGPKLVDEFLERLGVEIYIRQQVVHIMRFVSFRDSFDGCVERTDELNIVQDADRLDAIGAIGIARAFNYGGSVGADIYTPGEVKRTLKSKEEYIKSDPSTIGHFYEKLLKLKDLMNCDAGYKLAEIRHNYMEGFLEQFYSEWE